MPKYLIVLLTLFGFTAGPAAAADLTLGAESGYVIEAQVNGQPVRLRVDPAAPGYIVLNPAAVQRLRLRPSMMRSRTNIGPVRLNGRSKSARVTVGATSFDNRIVWMDRDIVTDADGLISPAVLPYDRVRFVLRPATQDEQSYRLAVTYAAGPGIVHVLRLGEQNVGVSISLNRGGSMATAAAGALMTAQFGGSWAGLSEDRPVVFGVVRPVRPLALERSLQIGGLPVRRLLVRTSDNPGSGASLPAEEGADPDEIVVTGNTGRQPPRYQFTLGTDALALCSSLVWDKAASTITLTCARSAA